MPETGLERDPDGLRAFARQSAKTVSRPVGTAKMRPDTERMAVVDAELRMRGVTGLRVGDDSFMPTLVSGNTNAPAMMIVERRTRFVTGKSDKAAAARTAHNKRKYHEDQDAADRRRPVVG